MLISCRSKIFPRFLVAFTCFTLLNACGHLLFYPGKQLILTPDFVGIDYQDVIVNTSEGGELHGWWLQGQKPARGVIYFLHGNGGNISTNLTNIFWLVGEGYHVFMLDYRGYGSSSGSPTVRGLVHDVQAGWGWLSEKHEFQQLPIYVVGQSLGASIAGYAMATVKSFRIPAAVILDSGFSEYSVIAKDVAAKNWLTWLFQFPVAWSMPNNFDLSSVMVRLSRYPLLIMHSRDDHIVPYRHAEKLQRASNGIAELYAYDGYHVSALQFLKYREKVLGFLNDHR